MEDWRPPSPTNVNEAAKFVGAAEGNRKKKDACPNPSDPNYLDYIDPKYSSAANSKAPMSIRAKRSSLPSAIRLFPR
jgi:hypothetical protein